MIADICEICKKEHGSIVCKEISRLSQELRLENGEREKRLLAKCNWEQMTRSAILHEYGDPKDWNC